MVGVDSRFRGNDGWWGWIPAFVGMAGDGVDFRFRGNDGVFFRVLGYGSMNSRVRGNCGFPPSRE